MFSVDPLTGDLIGKVDKSGVLGRQQSQLSAPAPAKSNNITNLKMTYCAVGFYTQITRYFHL